ncbi:MAG: ABC transporter ATP-binding protein [Candidatus Izemoplasmataceae bacterium]
MNPLLKVESLSVSYGAIHALKNVDIEVKKGSIVAILGANGGGKSTLLKKISGLITATNGQITFDEEVITKLQPEKITKKGIVHIPEGRQIFGDLTVYENLMIGAFSLTSKTVSLDHIHPKLTHKYEKRVNHQNQVNLSVKELIENNLTYVYEYFPVLLERKNQVALSLSGGEQQMLAIGRGLMGNPKLLILDEPSLGLAPLIVKNIFSIIKKLKSQGITILIVEQNALQTLKIADYAYVIQVGKIIKEGDAKTLMNDPELIEAYLGK